IPATSLGLRGVLKPRFTAFRKPPDLCGRERSLPMKLWLFSGSVLNSKGRIVLYKLMLFCPILRGLYTILLKSLNLRRQYSPFRWLARLIPEDAPEKPTWYLLLKSFFRHGGAHTKKWKPYR